ncbi:C4-dicarboxylate transporter DcuC [Mesosutterella sp. OilRF-GAM-744-9]|uniref:C4-dicarboxylate transporter DcuC n=1 Tax=Mesosutterella porci TaxID=2915351 RepID=A0ABS9MPN9_9BURK|nr:C4-dicarboxylate transporter DcuC [Mesosutterella sp. oilRF-744-WT-GAM-9]MCG5030008.1 C4-dicarboxylate transporter DcuC [Mesosutterella sp. oilRF-744-WT-GAM-9]
MHELMPYLALLVVVLTGVGIVKKLQVNILLLFAGLALNLIAILGGLDNLMPKGARSTGFIGFDLFALLSALSRNQAATTGFIILVAGGFAAYMDQIGATDKLVSVCMRPLQKCHANPFLILGAVFVMGNLLGLVVTSAAGMAMLLAVSVYPLLIGIGVSGVAAAAVIGSVLVISYAPSSAIAVLSATTAGVDPMTYLIHYQLPVAVPAILVTAVCHVLVQSWYDSRDAARGLLVKIDPKTVAEKADRAAGKPWFYALLPIAPIVMLFIFNKMVYKTVVLDVATAMFMGWVFAILVDLTCRRNLIECFKDGFAMFKGMGHMMQSVVGLIFVAALFAAGLKNAGLVSLLIDAARGAGFGMTGTGLVVSAVIGIVTVLTGSGVASFTGLVPIAPQVAGSLGGDPAVLAMMMQLSSEFLRPLSPVAGVIIIVAGFAGVSPLTVVRRTWLPCLAGLAVALALTILLF